MQGGHLSCALVVLLCAELPSPAEVENPMHFRREVASPGTTVKTPLPWGPALSPGPLSSGLQAWKRVPKKLGW